jgi:hypothetical protein
MEQIPKNSCLQKKKFDGMFVFWIAPGTLLAQ